jgi:hypothetical protein
MTPHDWMHVGVAAGVLGAAWVLIGLAIEHYGRGR